MLFIETYVHLNGYYKKSLLNGPFEVSDVLGRMDARKGEDKFCWIKSGTSESKVFIPYDVMKGLILKAYSDDRPTYLNLVEHSRPYRDGCTIDGTPLPLPELKVLAGKNMPLKSAATAKFVPDTLKR